MMSLTSTWPTRAALITSNHRPHMKHKKIDLESNNECLSNFPRITCLKYSKHCCSDCLTQNSILHEKHNTIITRVVNRAEMKEYIIKRCVLGCCSDIQSTPLLSFPLKTETYDRFLLSRTGVFSLLVRSRSWRILFFNSWTFY